MNILLDCDGVLLNWEYEFGVWAQNELGRGLATHANHWDLTKWLGETKEVADDMIRRFNHSSKFGQLKPMPGAVKVLQAYYMAGHELHVISSCSKNPDVVHLRKENLQREFGGIFASVTCLDLGETKAHTLAQHEPGSIWIEDNYNGAAVGHALGHVAMMLRWPHNMQWDDGCLGAATEIPWFDNWGEIDNALCVLASLLRKQSVTGKVNVTEPSSLHRKWPTPFSGGKIKPKSQGERT